MKTSHIFAVTSSAAILIILVLVSLGTETTLSQSAKGVSPHTVTYLARKYFNGTLKSERIVSRSVNERGEWYEETLYPQNGKGVAILEDGHYVVNRQTGDKVQYKSATPVGDCIGWVDKVKARAKDTIQIAGLTAYVVGGDKTQVGNEGLSYERAFAPETGCTPLRVRIKSNDGYEITYEALQVIFSVNSTFGKDIPVTKEARQE